MKNTIIAVIMAIVYLAGVCFTGAITIISLINQQWVPFAIGFLVLFIEMSGVSISVSNSNKTVKGKNNG